MDPNAAVDLMSWAQFVGLVAAPLMTLAVGYFTKVSWPGKYKGAILAAMSLANGFVVELFSHGYDFKTAVLRAVVAFVAAQAAYSAVISKTNLIGRLQAGGVRDTVPQYEPQHDQW